MDDTSLRFPVGKYSNPQVISEKEINDWINAIGHFPEELKNLIHHLSPAGLKSTYRPGGWTVSQIIHHLADSHMNAFIRFKLALTENNPIIKPYDQDKWSDLPDSLIAPYEESIKIITGIHARWVILLKSMVRDDFKRTFFHPERNSTLTLEETLGLYAWHGKHHLAHISLAIKTA